MAENKNFVILMMGYTAAGKSTVAKKLAKNIDCDLYHSAIIRKELGFKFTKKEAEDDFFLMTSKEREPMDKAVYQKLAAKTKESLLNKNNVIIDASHFFKWQRKNLYKNVANLNPNIFILKIECPEEEILKRLKKRAKNFSESIFNETPSIKAYESSKIILEEPEDDTVSMNKKPIIIAYNSYNKDIKVNNRSPNNNLNLIINTLKNENNKAKKS